ncbi:hypothetical protein EPUS_09365 [Endocarpon pusillum Z07020]|uniref:DAGKc domain-containing protein n=1 Tax=Endocarpon pusillum (strain Z07020 / HMAS-L-300199) TaxID=1263415 RepID=U1HS55_ENDPU|nr:uncharacterized protein EPUS_09365 [Endocarpon pusillum Z07020]ERF71999.1 hypothetical protein EPUS_09365 [Endocarpon pusillum Z07020]
MDSYFQDAVFMGEPAKLSLLPSSFDVQFSDRQLQIPTANIIAIHVTHRARAEVSESDSRIHAALFAAGNYPKDSVEQNDNQGEMFRLKSFQMEYTGQHLLPCPPLLLPHLPEHLRLPPKNGQANIHVVISTFSGTQKAEGFYELALKPLLDQLKVSPYAVHRTESADSISQLTRDIILPRVNQGIKQLIILLSGDGGMVDVVNTLFSEQMTTANAAIPIVGLIPMGTGNALYNSSCRPRPNKGLPATTTQTSGQEPDGTSEDQTRGLRNLLLGMPKPLPTFHVTFSPKSTSISYPASSTHPMHTPLSSTSPSGTSTLHGCVLTSWCLHASLISLSDAPAHRVHGSSRFSTAAKSLLCPPDNSPTHLYKGVVSTLHCDQSGQEIWEPLRERDGSIRREHMYILATLVSNLEEGFTVSPHSEPLDGKLRIVSIGAVGPEEVVRLLGLAYQGGRHVDDENGLVGYEEVEGLRIEFAEEDDDGAEDKSEMGRWRRVCVDGLIVECPRAGWVEVRRDRGRSVVELIPISPAECYPYAFASDTAPVATSPDKVPVTTLSLLLRTTHPDYIKTVSLLSTLYPFSHPP